MTTFQQEVQEEASKLLGTTRILLSRVRTASAAIGMGTTAPKPLEQKYADPYYQLGAGGEHYVMSEGIRSRHETSGEAYRIINMIKANKKEAAQ